MPARIPMHARLWFMLLLLTIFQAASGAPPPRVRGTVAAFDGQVLTVASLDGESVPLGVTASTAIFYAKAISLADIKPGDFIGTAAVPDSEGSLVAREVHLFPESARGAGEGHYPWDLETGATMTNANVAKMVQSGHGEELTLDYPGGMRRVRVPEGVPVVATVVGERSLLVPGAHVFVATRLAADGSAEAVRILVEKDGVKPPM